MITIAINLKNQVVVHSVSPLYYLCSCCPVFIFDIRRGTKSIISSLFSDIQRTFESIPLITAAHDINIGPLIE